MTDKQKAAFLRKEGWEFHPKYLWTKGALWPHELDQAYRIAKRRQFQREARALRRAGYWFNEGKWFHPGSTEESDGMSREEAVKLLSQRKP